MRLKQVLRITTHGWHNSPFKSREHLSTFQFPEDENSKASKIQSHQADAHHQYLIKENRVLKKQIPNDLLYLLKAYRSNSQSFNHNLRLHCPDSVSNWARNPQRLDVIKLDSIFSYMGPLKRTLTVYRGESFHCDHFTPPQVGDNITFRQYLSTSLDKRLAEGFCFLGEEAKDRHDLLYKIKLPSGHTAAYCPAADIDNHHLDYEKEVLLPRNSSFIVEKLSYEKSAMGKYYLQIKLTPQICRSMSLNPDTKSKNARMAKAFILSN